MNFQNTVVWSNYSTSSDSRFLHWLHLSWLILLIPSVSHALECPRVPEQARNDLEIVVRSAVGKIGAAKESELESRTRNVTRDLLGKLPKADKVYLELMMYAAYCSTLRDDAALTEAEKSARIRAYNLELKRALEGVEGSGSKYRADPRDVARAELERIPLPYTIDAFVKSAEKGSLAAVKLFLAAGMDPNGKTEYGDSALIEATRGGHAEIVRVLLKAKANVNQWNRYGTTAVYPAADAGHNDILRLLLGQGVDAETIQFPFKVAAKKGNTEALRMLLKFGIDNNTRNMALIEAAGGDASEEHLNEAVILLLGQGADVNARTEGGCTALAQAAARTERAAVIRTLLDAGANINSKSTCSIGQGWTPLMYALSDVDSPNRMDVVNLLLARGANPNLAGEDGMTTLMVAARFRDIDMVRNLLDRGMDPNQADNDGGTALMEAALKDQYRRQVSSRNITEIVRLLLDRGANPNLADKYGNTALTKAALTNNMEAVRLLLERGANPNAKSKTENETALMWAAEKRFTDIVEALLDAGADLNAKSTKGKTALMVAVQYGSLDTVQALLRRGAKVDDEDAVAKTVLNYAEGYPQEPTRTDMIRVLKKAGAK
jgi:ankyrin repeat protein